MSSLRSSQVVILLILVSLLGTESLCMENWPPFWVGPDGDYTRTRAARSMIPRKPVVTDMLFVKEGEGSDLFSRIYSPSVYADGTVVVAAEPSYDRSEIFYCISSDWALRWTIRLNRGSDYPRPELLPGPDNTVFLNHTDYRDGDPYSDQFLACYSLESGDQLWSTTTTIKDTYYALSYDIGPDLPYVHIVDRGADVGPDGVLYGWSGPSTGYVYDEPGVLIAACTTGTIGVLDQVENPNGTMRLNRICMLRGPGDIAVATWDEVPHGLWGGTDLYDYTYDPGANAFSNRSWSTASDFMPLVRPILIEGNIFITCALNWSELSFHVWPPDAPISAFEPDTQMRPSGRILYNTGRVLYVQDLYADTSEDLPPGFHAKVNYRAYVDGYSAWDTPGPSVAFLNCP